MTGAYYLTRLSGGQRASKSKRAARLRFHACVRLEIPSSTAIITYIVRAIDDSRAHTPNRVYYNVFRDGII